MDTKEKNVVYETISVDMWNEMEKENLSVPVMMRTQGISMWPLLRYSGDHVQMIHPQRELKKGDIITFLRADGKEITHRLYKMDGDTVQTLGDNCDKPDAKISRDKVMGLVTHVSHRGHLIHVDTKFWRAYGHIMMWSMPFRMFIRNRLYRPVKYWLWRHTKGRKKK